MSNLTMFIIAFFATICVVTICNTIKEIMTKGKLENFVDNIVDEVFEEIEKEKENE